MPKSTRSSRRNSRRSNTRSNRGIFTRLYAPVHGVANIGRGVTRSAANTAYNVPARLVKGAKNTTVGAFNRLVRGADNIGKRTFAGLNGIVRKMFKTRRQQRR